VDPVWMACRVAIRSAFMGLGALWQSQDAIILRLCRARQLSFERHGQHEAKSVISRTSKAHPRIRPNKVLRAVFLAVRDEWTGF
jgi:hypothetical protein